MKGKYLISTDSWFWAPNGQQYKAVWGDVEIVEDTFLGLKTNRMSTNWFAKIGSEDNHVIVAGCQIHYAIKCNAKPSTDPYRSEIDHDGKLNKVEYPSRIYIAD